MKTKTAAFGVTKRENHDSSVFYSRKIYDYDLSTVFKAINKLQFYTKKHQNLNVHVSERWYDTIYCHSSEDMHHIPDNAVALAFTSPPYNVGKEYDGNLELTDYLGLIARVGAEVYRILKPGGRYVINIANLGRKPYIPLHTLFYIVHVNIGFLPMGEIIWQKAKGANGSCAWGTWMSAKCPRIRDLHEYLLVFAKEDFSRPEKGESDITRDEFLSSTLSVWEIQPESAKKVGHPAPFPVKLAERVIKLYSYIGDVVLDPFMGSGTTCIAAAKNKRHYVGYDIVPEYCRLAEERIRKEIGQNADA